VKLHGARPWHPVATNVKLDGARPRRPVATNVKLDGAKPFNFNIVNT
jgi:hypothetical protein